MIFENLVISEAGIRDIIVLSLTIITGIFVSVIFGYLMKRFADSVIYPSIRKSSPKKYKGTVNIVNLITMIIQWIIIFIFIFQAFSIFNISIFQEIVNISVGFLPKLAIALLIIVIGLLINSFLSRKILEMNFESRLLTSKVFGFIFMFAVILSALEAVDIHLTPFMDLFRVFLYTIGLTLAIGVGLALSHIIKPEIEAMLKKAQAHSER